MADEHSTLTADLLHQLFEYRDGDLYWKVNRGARKVKGNKAGRDNGKGYIRTQMFGKMVVNHRIIFVMHHGWNPKYIDHIDNNKLNNKIENLRPASKIQNGQNSKKPVNNTSGSKCVHWHKSRQKWQVILRVNGKPIYFGIYDDLELAELVAAEARAKHHGAFARDA